MSRRRPRRTSQKSSQPSSTICKPEASAAPSRPEFELRAAQSDEDIAAIHRFLLIVSQPILLAPVDPLDSMREVYRVVKQEAAWIALIDGEIVGSLGMIYVPWWFNGNAKFFTDRWCFVLPQYRNAGIADAMIGEADAIAAELQTVFILNGKSRRKDMRSGRQHVVYVSPRKVPVGLPTKEPAHVLRNESDAGNREKRRRIQE